jgi:vesicle-associated membrane protein 7
MAIQYALVARGTAVLAEHSAAATNAGAVARQVLERLSDGGADSSHVSYTQDRYVFHAKRTDGITVLCMADDAAGREHSFLHPAPAVP